MKPISELAYRDDQSGPDGRAEVYRLIRDTFDADVSPLDDMGVWDPTYRAFSYLDADGLCVANAATCTLNLVINGSSVRAMGIQSVATRPAWRGRGLSRDLLRRALEWCDIQSPLTYLLTAIPAFYEPLGFRTVPQFKHVGDAPPVPPPSPSARKLDLGSWQDRDLLVRILRRRTPVSSRFAVDGLQGAFALNLLNEPELKAWHLPGPDAVVVTAGHPDETLRLVGIAAAEMPSVREVLAGLGATPARVEVHFPPDRMDWLGTAVPAETPLALMVRGDPGPLDRFMLPETASF